jgi:hypothetical protein
VIFLIAIGDFVRFKQLDFQSVEAPIEIRFVSDNLEQLKEQGEKFRDRYVACRVSTKSRRT